MSPKIIDLELYCFHETGAAYLVSVELDRKEAIWLPKSLCERGDEVRQVKGIGLYEFQIEEWIAIDKELI